MNINANKFFLNQLLAENPLDLKYSNKTSIVLGLSDIRVNKSKKIFALKNWPIPQYPKAGSFGNKIHFINYYNVHEKLFLVYLLFSF